MNYYIADLHIAHKNVCKEGNNFDNRPFETMEEMMRVIKKMEFQGDKCRPCIYIR